MEEIREELENLRKLSIVKENLGKMRENLKEKEKQVESLSENAKTKMIGTVDREMATEELETAEAELKTLKEEENKQNEQLTQEFTSQKEKVLSCINDEMAKYKPKSEIDKRKEELETIKSQKESQKKAYEKVAENAQKTIEKLIAELNEGKNIDQSMLNTAREELTTNKGKAEKLRTRNS